MASTPRGYGGLRCVLEPALQLWRRLPIPARTVIHDKGNPVARRARKARGLHRRRRPSSRRRTPMLHHRLRAVGLAAILAALVFAPSAVAATPSKMPTSAKAKERAYGKHCGPKTTAASGAASRVKCIDAMAKLASGASSSPRKACRELSRKRAKGKRRSPFARCVVEGAKLLKGTDRASGGDSASADDDVLRRSVGRRRDRRADDRRLRHARRFLGRRLRHARRLLGRRQQLNRREASATVPAAGRAGTVRTIEQMVEPVTRT